MNPRLRPSRRRGLTLAESLISLAICAALLTALGGAFTATARALTENNEFASAVQTARLCLARLESDIRRGTLDPTIATAADGSVTAIRLISAEGGPTADRTYRYDAQTKRVLLVTNAIATDQDFVLASNVTSGRCVVVKGTDANGNACVRQVAITLTVTVGDNSATLSGSAAPRKSLAN